MNLEEPLASIELASLDDSQRLGHLLATCLPARACVGLTGTLGAGKTTLVQSFIAAHGFQRSQVTSPTFSLVQTYTTPERTIHHVDAYRIRDEDEFFELGAEELLDDPAATVLIEWADKFRDYLPVETLWIAIDWRSDESRQVRVGGVAQRWQPLAERIAHHFRKSDHGRGPTAASD